MTTAAIGSTQQIAFYAPLKSPRHSTPSGDRKIAQLFYSALQHVGFDVQLASQLRCFDKQGNAERQQRMIALARKEAARIIKRWDAQNFRPCAWFSYHLYYKAPDLLGPIICKQLNIPYLVAEASWAIKRATGPWSLYHQQLDQALRVANKVICINPIDKLAINQYYATQAPNKVISMNAFIDDLEADASLINKEAIAEHYKLDPQKPWLVCIAMMRSGDKYRSYQQLSEVIHKLELPYQLLIIGDGQMRAQTEQLFSDLSQVVFCGALNSNEVNALLAHCDLLVWPAINEALGMVFLEAQRAGVAVVAGDQGGVSSIVKHDHSGLLSDAYDSTTMAANIQHLLEDPRRLAQLKGNTQSYIAEHHSLAASAKQLSLIIQHAIEDFS